MEKKVYSGWADDDVNGQEKVDINQQILKELKPKTKFFRYDQKPTEEDLKKYMCYNYIGAGYAVARYQILSNPHNFTKDELALICDSGNLCFGYRTNGTVIVIYTD